MKASIAQKIARYKFQDNLKTVYVTPVGHLCLFSCFALSNTADVVENSFAILSLIIAILFFIGIKLNNWQSNQLNLCFICFYLIIIFGEWHILGIPNSTVGFKEGFSVRKGILLEFMGGLTPLIYVGMRIFLLIPLILMVKSSYHLNNSLKIND